MELMLSISSVRQGCSQALLSDSEMTGGLKGSGT